MSVNFKIKANIKAMQNMRRLADVNEDIRRGIRQAYYRTGKKTLFDISKDILRKPRFGRVYFLRKRPGGRVYRHVASQPGEAPANFTGRLRKSLDFLVKGHSELEIGYDSSVDYGIDLELGKKKMEPRPAIQTGIQRNIDNGFIEKTFEQELKKAIKLRGR